VKAHQPEPFVDPLMVEAEGFFRSLRQEREGK
jgi:hypothetical protein